MYLISCLARAVWFYSRPGASCGSAEITPRPNVASYCKEVTVGSKVFLDLSFSQEHQCILTGSADRHVRLYDLRSTDGTLVKQSYTSHNGWVSGVRWAPHNENLFVTASYDKLVKLWDLRSPTSPLYDLKGHEDKVLCVD